MHSIDPAPQHFKSLIKTLPLEQPIMMLNMLRFRAQANYADDAGVTACSGLEAYQRYSDLSFGKIKDAGGRISFQAKALASVIAPVDEIWDKIFIVNWPSFQVFLNVIMDKDYQAGTFHRTAALLDSRLIMLEESTQ